MKVVIVTFDLTKTSDEYESLYATLKLQGTWWHYMKSTWLIHTDKTVQQIADTLTPHLKGKGTMLVAELHSPYQGLQVKDAWTWIRTRVT